MTKRQERSRELFLSGYNCAQSVLIPFADVLGLTEEQAAKIAKWRQWSYYKLMYKEID